VTKAFDWLDDLAVLKDDVSDEITFNLKQGQHAERYQKNYSIRLFSTLEIEKFDIQARGVLIDLVELNVITPGQRELIIDKALALDIAHIDQEQMKRGHFNGVVQST